METPDTSTPVDAAPQIPPAPPLPLLSFWPCIVGAIAVVFALFYMPWSAVGAVLSTVLSAIGSVIDAAWGVFSVAMFAMGSLAIAIPMSIFLAGLCIMIKSDSSGRRIQGAGYVVIAAAISAFWLFLVLMNSLNARIFEGTASEDVIQSFTTPNSAVASFVHNLPAKDAAILIAFLRSNRDSRYPGLLPSYSPETEDKLDTLTMTPSQSRSIRSISVDNLLVEFYDPESHNHRYRPVNCKALEGAYLSSPIDIQKRYRLVIAGKVVAPGSSAAVSACHPRQKSDLEIRWIGIKR